MNQQDFLSFLEKRDEVNRMLHAACGGDLNLFKKLKHELDEEHNLTGKFGFTKIYICARIVHCAAKGGQIHVLKYLVGELKLDVNVKDNKGDTPLHCATEWNHFPAAVYLIDNGANLNVTNGVGATALHNAAVKGPKQLVQLLISKGAEVDANPDSGTPLQWAVVEGKKDSVKVLLKNNANPNICKNHNISPLVAAIDNKSTECVKLLLKAGADPNITAGGDTPLDRAVSNVDTEIVKCLLNAGADPNVQNDCGLTPIEVAALARNHDAVTTLYPFTSPISDYLDWSVDGIRVQIDSEEMREKRKQKTQQNFMESRLKGREAVKRLDYHDAIKWYTKAINCNCTDAAMFSNRSLCWARLEDGMSALADAEICVVLSPLWPKAYYRYGVAYMLLKDFEKAADAFYDAWKLDWDNKELENAFRDAVEARRKHGEEEQHFTMPHETFDSCFKLPLFWRLLFRKFSDHALLYAVLVYT